MFRNYMFMFFLCIVSPVFANETAEVSGIEIQSDATGRAEYLCKEIKDQNKRDINIAFLGGSITNGVGASHPSRAYWRLCVKNLNEAMKDQGYKFNGKCAAVGGTNSLYGVFRMSQQILLKNTDILVVEFAVNDMSSKTAEDAMEGIVRKAWSENPNMLIVFFYSTNRTMLKEYYDKNKLPKSVEAHHTIAKYYGVAEIHSGPEIKAKIDSGEFKTDDFWKDISHPKDIGHKYYAKIISEKISQLLKSDKTIDESSPCKLPDRLGKVNYQEARMIAPTDEALIGKWDYTKPKIYTYLGTWQPLDTDSSLTIKPKDGHVGLLVLGGPMRIEFFNGNILKIIRVSGSRPQIPRLIFLPDEFKDSDNVSAKLIPVRSSKKPRIAAIIAQ